MKFSNSLRLQITGMLAALAALWFFAAWVTAQDGLNLLTVQKLDTLVGQPTVKLVSALQQERRLTAIRLARPGEQEAEARLRAQRTESDAAVAAFRRLAGGEDALSASAALHTRITQTLHLLDGLAGIRQQVDGGGDRAEAAAAFNAIVDAASLVWGSNAALDDQELAKDTRTLIDLIVAKEIMSREDALVAGAAASGRITAAEHAEVVRLSGAQRFMRSRAAAELRAADRSRYEAFINGASFTRFKTTEDRIAALQPGRGGARLPVSASQWQSTTEPALAGLEKVVLQGGLDVVERAKPAALWVIARFVIAGVLGLLAVVASIAGSYATARRLIRQLELLRDAARDLAQKRLPQVVDRIGHGATVDVKQEAPPLAFGTDLVGQVAEAFNDAQETAIATAAEQAELRRGIRDLLLSLARRIQPGIQRQLHLLDWMEREQDVEPKVLDRLYEVDHLAVRMRRNAENMIVLSGAAPARSWREPQLVLDVIRSAVQEIEQYSRVEVVPPPEIRLAGRTVADVSHLLSELIENATSFSPPSTPVVIGADRAAAGLAITVEDRGLGMKPETQSQANEMVKSPPGFVPEEGKRLGLYVVGKLADRHGITVTFTDSVYGGTRVVVLLPSELLEDPIAGDADDRGDRQPIEAVAFSPSGGSPLLATPPTLRLLATVPAPKSAGSAGSAGPGTSAGPGEAAGDLTSSGLPVRRPQASLAEPLRGASASGSADPADETGPTPEEIRTRFTQYQEGTEKGRRTGAQPPASSPEQT